MSGPDMVTILISIVIKPLLLLSVMGLLYLLLTKSSAALRHFVLLMGVVALLILPVTAFLIPDMAWQFPFSQILFDLLPFSWKEYLLKTSYIQIEPLGWQITLVVYLLISGFLLFYLLIGFVQLWIIYSRSRLVTDQDSLQTLQKLSQLLGINRSIKLVTHKDIESPCVWGFWQPKILLPVSANNWNHDQKISVLMHELGHIHRRDTLGLILVKLSCAIFWFLPPVWWVAKKISATAEIACDDLIYQLRDKQIQYAEHLLQLADHKHASAAAMPMSGHSEIYHRIMAVLDAKQPREGVKAEKIQYPVLLGVILVMLLAALSNIQFPTLEQGISKVNLVWDKPESTRVYPTSEVISDAENTLIKVNWMENQDKPVMDNQTLPSRDQQFPDLKNEYQLDINKDELRSLAIDPIGDSTNIDSNQTIKPAYQQLVAPPIVYPEAAMRKAISGFVKVSFELDESGVPSKIQIEESNPQGVFDQAVLNALQKSRYAWQSQSDPQARIQRRFSFQLEKPRTR
jgi:bla regulator protein blaR1